MAEAATKLEEKPRDVQLTSGRIKLASEAANRWGVTLTPDMTYEDILTPRFWAHVAVRFTNGDLIDVRTDNETHYGLFYVIDCSRIHTTLKELMWISLEDKKGASVDYADDYEYKWKGPHLKHCVIRKQDGEMMQKEIASKADALQWIANKR